MRTHDEFRELLGVYALDAVEPDEAEDLERHLETCPRCRAEVAAHREVAGLLGYSGADAPPDVWDRIIGATQSPPPAFRPPTPGVVLGGRRGPVRSRRGLVGVLVAAAAAVAIAVLSWQVVRLNNRVDVMTASAPTMSTVNAALREPGARTVVMADHGGRVELDAVVLPGGSGYVYHGSLPPLPDGQTYQLWGIGAKGQAISYGLLGNAPAVVAFRASPDVKTLAVTAEVAGGSIQPTHAPLIAGGVRST